MQSSARLNQIKTQVEVNGRIDNLYKVVDKLRNDVNNIKDDITTLKESLKSEMDLTNKKFKELYSFMKRLEEAYSNGLSADLSLDGISNIDNFVDSGNNPDRIINSNDEVFTLESTFEYDKLRRPY